MSFKNHNLNEYCKNADIIITAVGDRSKFKLTSDMIKQDAIVIDVGINKTENGIVGDVAFDEVSKVAKALTPVPGGVGPMTIACLLKILLSVLKDHKNKHFFISKFYCLKLIKLH